MDLSANAVAFSRRHHHSGNGLRYVQGDAEDLSFSDASFDAVINIESSHCYGEMARFLREVHRVLRPGGHLLWADTLAPHQHGSLHQDIQQSGFEVVREETITPNVLAAMNLQKERNRELADRIAPWFARKVFYHFAGVEGASYIYDFLRSGRLRYLHMVLRKAA
jgi:ubiquinone/menaquinone biosynthesis C-methylase UbiE